MYQAGLSRVLLHGDAESARETAAKRVSREHLDQLSCACCSWRVRVCGVISAKSDTAARNAKSSTGVSPTRKIARLSFRGQHT